MRRTAFSAAQKLSLALLFPLLLDACSIVRETQPGRTAMEQLLFSTAVDRAADAITLKLEGGTKVFVDPAFVEGTDSRYLVGTVRDRILRRGGLLVADRASADLVVEPRVGALSVDRNATLYGLPALGLPVPLADDFKTPELALYKRDRQQGVVKLAMTAFDAKTGRLVAQGDPVYGFSHSTEWRVLLFFAWDRNDLVPAPENEDWVNKDE